MEVAVAGEEEEVAEMALCGDVIAAVDEEAKGRVGGERWGLNMLEWRDAGDELEANVVR